LPASPLRCGQNVSNALRIATLLAALTAFFIGVGGVCFGQVGMLLAFGLAIPMNLGAYWFSGNIALHLAGAREVTPEQAPELHRLVDELAAYARVPKPRVAIVESASPNAFATGRDAQHAVVGVTRGMLSVLSREELAGVLAHELGHVRNRDILLSSIAATLAGAITTLAHLAHWSVVLGDPERSNDEGNGGLGRLIGGLLMIILAPIAATLIQLAITRSREYRADATGADIHGNPASLARALEKLNLASSRRPLPINPSAAHLFIVNPLAGLSFCGLFNTHPPVTERVRRLRQMGLNVLAM
jgi:heat shock protein HtpX